MPLLKLHLAVFYSTSISDLTATSGTTQTTNRPSEKILKALGCLGFIRYYHQAKHLDWGPDTAQGGGEDRYSRGHQTPDPQLASLLKGRTLAIVGPSRGDDNTDEINSYDIVMRIGYTGPGSLPVQTGSRCELAFYASHKIRLMLAQGKTDALYEPQLIMVTPGKKKPSPRQMLDNAGVSISQIAQAVSPSFRNGGANALVKALYNCLLCEPERIKVFNTDLFLSSHYPKAYIANKNTTEENGSWRYENMGMCHSFAMYHDPAEQIEFYKYYYRGGCFEADRRLDEIIRMPTIHYIDELDRRYGLPLRHQLGLN